MTVLFVAEVSSNHNRDLDRSYRFIETARDIGCGAVKFQLFRVDELFAPEILEKSEAHRNRREWELPVSFLPHLSAKCRDVNIQFGCTPFYLRAVEELFPHVDFYKIASYEILWRELLVECAKTGKPVVLSTGMATLDEVKDAVDTIMGSGCRDLTLLHCVSGYPTPSRECNLAAIDTLRKEFLRYGTGPATPESDGSIGFGWSDHTVKPGVIYRAIHRWGARMIEFHLDLDGDGEEFKAGHCWLPEEMRVVTDAVGDGLGADGSGEKTPSSCEMPDRDWRADPVDGLRPLIRTRSTFNG